MLVGFLLCGSAGEAKAALVFVGSWQVYDPSAPVWSGSPPNGPLAYTGQEAAALLFGGNPSDYVISTVDSNPANVNHMAWYDTIGIGGGIFAEDYDVKYLGLYYGPTSGYSGVPVSERASSAFIRDNFVTETNFAFIEVVPEPTTMALFGLCVAGAGVYAWRHRKLAQPA
jgi:hypothetical protein